MNRDHSGAVNVRALDLTGLGRPVRSDKCLTIVILLLAAFALRVWNLGGRSLWYDEAYLWWATRLPLGKMLALSMGELVPPLHYFVLRVW